ncbi:hypothetical protein [Actinokineospora pegani]|uniref:hypothetical protein n=1 Tax=Actinokineospora pegani TaxID=2654637 RepID=UPI0012EAF9B8|nr:hypothetical protein [Actinokineospora pegani]
MAEDSSARPVFDSDPADPLTDRVKVLRGAPEGTRDVRVRFRAGGGLLGRRTVRRDQADSALLTYVGGDEYKQEEVLTLAGVDEFFAEVRARAAEEDAVEAAKNACVHLRCRYCDVRAEYLGTRTWVVGEPTMTGTALRSLSEEAVTQHVYRCPRCGLLELFAEGFLRHPVPEA